MVFADRCTTISEMGNNARSCHDSSKQIPKAETLYPYCAWQGYILPSDIIGFLYSQHFNFPHYVSLKQLLIPFSQMRSACLIPIILSQFFFCKQLRSEGCISFSVFSELNLISCFIIVPSFFHLMNDIQLELLFQSQASVGIALSFHQLFAQSFTLFC